jgi:hypothetical protein
MIDAMIDAMIDVRIAVIDVIDVMMWWIGRRERDL